MSDFAFPSRVAAALDRLTVPPLPTGFADRLVERIVAGDLPVEAINAIPPLPRSRTMFINGRGWRRGGRIMASVAALGLATATAAASGAFGEPVYIPVVSDALAQANLVELPSKPKLVEPVKAKPVVAADITQSVSPKRDGKQRARELILAKWKDPEFRKMPKEQRQAVMRDSINAAIADGSFTRDDLRAAMADARAEREGRKQLTGVPNPKRQQIEQKLREKVETARERYAKASPEEKAIMRERGRGILDQQRRLRELRQQLADAPPEAKAAIRNQIRTIREEIAALINNAPADSEGNADQPR